MAKVLLVTPKYPPDTGGAAEYARVLARALSQNGHQVQILTTRVPGAVSPPERNVARRLPPIYASRHFVPRMWEALSRQAILALTLYAAGRRCTVVHIHNSLAGPLVGWMARVLGLAVLVDIRDHLRIPAPNGYRGAIAVSAELADEARAKGFDAVALPLPLTEDLPARSVKKRRVVLYAGQITDAKGARRFWQAAHILETSGWLEEWDGLAIMAGACVEGWTPRTTRRIRYLGPLPHAELMRILAEASLLVLPSATEGIPRVVAEATKLGVPVLVSGCDGLGPGSAESILDQDEVEPEKLAERIRAALTCPPRLLDLDGLICRHDEFPGLVSAAYARFGIGGTS